MSVKITGKQWKEFLEYVVTPAFADNCWVYLDTVTGTINGKTPEKWSDDWDYEQVSDGDVLVITGGQIMDGDAGSSVYHSDLVQTLKKHFCKL